VANLIWAICIEATALRLGMKKSSAISREPQPTSLNWASLKSREAHVAELVAAGYSNGEIAAELTISEQVVKNILHSVFDRLGVWNRVELAKSFWHSRSARSQEESLLRIEAERLAELQRQKILDSTAESVFDELATLTANIFKVPIALIALADSSRIWFKSNVGLNASDAPRELTICHDTMQQSKVLVVGNAAKDPRFSCNLFVKEFGVGFYAAAPILTDDGYALGVVCIVDHRPRAFSSAQRDVLQSLARIVLEQIKLRRRLLELGGSM
jgi:GAF domain-containing protein